eukprot:TRINITY_DN18490_c0_g1_i1.p1 TRINITY_DN18490_c0_g1~~TRINITY_DN18490_c0_g1_i1.p1  ORF type:complete len:615 (+),score=163.03 TRINITY_DN18490_c0_g1_i1:132-1847(+)
MPALRLVSSQLRAALAGSDVSFEIAAEVPARESILAAKALAEEKSSVLGGQVSRPSFASASFYLDCAPFGISLAAPKRMASEAIKEVGVEHRMQLLHQLEHPPQTYLGGEHVKGRNTASLTAAAKHCAEDELCVALCRSESTGKTFYLHGKITEGLETPEPKKEQGAWTCLARKGHEPAIFHEEDAVRRECFAPLGKDEGRQADSILPARLALNFEEAPKGMAAKAAEKLESLKENAAEKTASLKGKAAAMAGKGAEQEEEKKTPTNVASLKVAKLECAQDPKCQALCYHKESGRMLLYGDVERELAIVGRWQLLWASASDPKSQELISPPEQDDSDWSSGWQCFQVSSECRKAAVKKGKEAAKAAREAVREEEESLEDYEAEAAKAPPDMDQVLGSPGAINAWGATGCKIDKEFDKDKETCAKMVERVRDAEMVKALSPMTCMMSKRFYVRLSGNMWAECCGRSAMKCRTLHRDGRSFCQGCTGENQACLATGLAPSMAQPKTDQPPPQHLCADLGKPGDEKVLFLAALSPSTAAAVAVAANALPRTLGLSQPRGRRSGADRCARTRSFL